MLLLLVLVGWAGSGALVTWRLTRRAHPPSPEPVDLLAPRPIEPYRLVTADGLELGAWLVRGEPGHPCVLLLHGNGGSRSAWRPLLQELVGQGHCVLAVSLRAHGDSDGEVIVFGTSLGSAAALFAAREVGTRVRGYVLESPYRDLRTAVANRLERYLWPGLDRLAFHGMWLFGDTMLPVAAERIRPLDHVNGIPPEVPVLILAGAKDIHAHLDEAEDLAARIASHARLEVFREGAHGTLEHSEPERYHRLVFDFVRAPEALVPGKTPP